MKKNYFLFNLFSLFLLIVVILHEIDGFKPVIIVPGTGGSRLEAKLNKPSVNHWYCSATSDWYTLWLSVASLLPPAINCWVDNIMLLWDPNTKQYSNNLGIETRVPYSAGSTNNFEYLDTSIPYGDSDYFYTLVEAMVGAGGVRNVSIRGSPYDFRFAPSSVYYGSWLAKMTRLVEETYLINQNSRVTLLSHSMGCLYTLWFLNQKSQEWKDKYIAKWIPTAGVFGGAGTGIKQVLSGDVSIVPIPGITGLTVRGEQRSYESSLLLLPTPQVWGNDILIQTPSRGYTSADYQILFDKSNFQYGYDRYQLIGNLTADLVPPGVDTVHMYGTEVNTGTVFRYASDTDFDTEPETIFGNGDGTVPLKSLMSVGRKWSNENNNGKLFEEVGFSQRTHSGILKDQEYIQQVMSYLN